MQENSIAEVRGIAPDQNLDPYIAPIVQEKMKTFPDGAQYEKKASDMKRLTTLEEKAKLDQGFKRRLLSFFTKSIRRLRVSVTKKIRVSRNCAIVEIKRKIC